MIFLEFEIYSKRKSLNYIPRTNNFVNITSTIAEYYNVLRAARIFRVFAISTRGILVLRRSQAHKHATTYVRVEPRNNNFHTNVITSAPASLDYVLDLDNANLTEGDGHPRGNLLAFLPGKPRLLDPRNSTFPHVCRVL